VAKLRVMPREYMGGGASISALASSNQTRERSSPAALTRARAVGGQKNVRAPALGGVRLWLR
jgi:hypothetical protein